MDFEKEINKGVAEIGKLTNLERLNIPEAVVMLSLGLIVLLFGYRIKKIAFFIIWFLLGFNLVMWLIPTIEYALPEVAENQLVQSLLPIGGGALLALLGFSIEKICVSGICFAVIMLITIQYFGTEMQVLAIGGIIGIVLAGVAVMMMKPATIIVTATVGAYVLTLAIFKFTATGLDFNVYYWPILVGIAAIGSLFQFRTTRRIS